jgi:hypothetical protein
MTRIMLSSPWFGICVAILCLGASEGCRCAGTTCQPVRPACLSRGAATCDPCYGYRPTCWTRWPDCCRPCPPPEQIIPIPHGLPGNAAPGDASDANSKDLEPVPKPVPQAGIVSEPPEPAASLPKVNQSPKARAAKPVPKAKTVPKAKADEPLPVPEVKEPPEAKPAEPSPMPKAKESPKAVSPVSDDDKSLSVVPIQPSSDDSSSSSESDAAASERAFSPRPNDDNVAADTQEVRSDGDRQKTDHERLIPTRDVYNMCLALLAPEKHVGLVLLAPEKKDLFPEIRQVAFGQEEDGRSNGQYDQQRHDERQQQPPPARLLSRLNHEAGHVLR